VTKRESSAEGGGGGPSPAEERDQAGEQRDQAGDQRDQAGEQRDQAGEQRDHAAEQRDKAAEQRDQAAEQHETSVSAGIPTDALSRSALARRQAASDRKGASQDRQAGASERTQAELDRNTALADRGSGASERTEAELDRATNRGLSTVNDDLGNRNLELTRLSDDLSNVLTSTHVPMIIVGPDGRIRRMTQATERALSLTAGDIGRPIGQLRLGVEFPDLEAMVKAAIETPAPVEREVQTGDGRSYSVRVRPYHAAGNTIEGAVVSFIDIDDLKRTEREVREARDVARATFETVREPLVTLDASLHVVQANRSFYETFRVTPAATEGTFIYDLGNRQWDIPELRRLLEEILPRDTVVSDFEVEHAFEGLGQRTMRLNASLVLRATADDPLILLAIEDVTAEKELERTRAALVEREQALRAAAEQATQAKDRFLAVLSHELRSPLQSMLGWVRMLQSRRLSAAHTERALDVIERNTVLQARMIEDLLDVSRITAGVLQLDLAPMLVASAVQTVIENLRPAADAKRIRLVVSIEEAAYPIQGDAARVQQIVGNLVSNAMKFTPDGGRIAVRIARSGSEVEIQVSDTGAGISADQLTQVFAPFGTEPRKRSHGGLGLGLGIARHLTELHGGALNAASAGLGHGATFTVTLPLAVERAADEQADRAAASGPTEGLAGRHVLVVEDDADVREVITVMLEDRGAVVTAAATVAAALSELERVRPDVLLSDLSLPGRDGYDFIRSVRALDAARGGSIPAIALTAYASTEDRERVMAAGFQRYLAKPIDLPELVAAIVMLVDRTEQG
jgi:two-component system CheB/CheR fusion protein